MRRPQFTLRALLILLLAVACIFSGIRFERERRRREDDAARWIIKPVDFVYFPDLRAAMPQWALATTEE